MPKPRKTLINIEDTPYYHCVSRCVRRAYLCGEDTLTGKSYEHRRQWVEDRIIFLAKVLCVDVCAYAVMSNHTHIVLRINKQKADRLTVDEALRRWHKLYKGQVLSHRYLDPEARSTMSSAEVETVTTIAKIYRKRLCDISWFMRLLNEYIARKANKEDDCTGHFWEGRFKSQALIDEAALTACMAYVDLNPIRACVASTPETSAHTSIQKRINAAKKNRQPRYLMPFVGNPRKDMPDGLPFRFWDYLELVEQSGRRLHPDKYGRIDPASMDVLKRIGLAAKNWDAMISDFESQCGNTVSQEKIQRCISE